MNKIDKNEIVKNCYYLEAEKYKDGLDGWLGILENNKHVPFDIKRVYFIYNLINHEDAVRGKHAHKKLKQALFCISGSCDIIVDDGERQEKVSLNKTHTGLYLGPSLWHEMKNFQNNCIILVLASDFYVEEDYIRDYQKFIAHINSGKKIEIAPSDGGKGSEDDSDGNVEFPRFFTDLKV
jgi:dTDP-4-dehydrorhamnose 3,5-epimerase-like enzyme